MSTPSPAPRPTERAGTLVIRGDVIVYASEGAAALAGRPVADVVGRAFEEFLDPGERPDIRERHERRLRGEPATSGYEVTIALPGGERRHVELHVEQDGGDFLVQVRDADAREARRLRLEAVAALGAAIQGELAEPRIHERVGAELRTLGLCCALARPEPDGVRLLWAAVPDEVAEGFRAILGRPLAGHLGRWTPFSRKVWTEGAAFCDEWPLEASRLVPDEVAAPVRDLVSGAGMAKAVAVRLDQRDAAECYLVVAGEWVRSDDAPALRLFGSQIAAALDAARTIADLSRRNAELAALNRIAELASEATELDTLFALCSEVLRAATGCAAVAVFVGDEVAGDLVRIHCDGVPPHVAARTERLSLSGVRREAMRDRATRVVGVAEVEPELACLGFETFAWVPLVVRGEAIGVLGTCYHARAEEVRRRVGLLGAVAAHLAAAIESRRLLADLRGRVRELSGLAEETRRRAEQLGLLHEVGRSLVATLDIERVLDTGVRNLARIVDAPDAYLALASPGRDDLEVVAVAGAHPEHLGRRLSLDDPGTSLPALVFDTREPIVVEDGIVDPRVNQTLRASTGGRGYLGLPLAVRDNPIGAILIVETRGPRLFTPAEVERAAGIANQLAVAVENARLYEDLRRSYAELERAQQRLVRRERLAALGELSAVVAHEVRNPLGVIFNSLGSLRRLLRPTGDAQVLLDIVGEEADRLNRIVGDLLDFARPSTPELRPEPLGRVVEEAIGAALAERPEGVVVARELDPAVPPVPMDAHLVRQAVVNVAVNAVQAMPRGGRLTVRTRRAADAAVLEIEDTGVGMPDEVRERIFEPFFTTKASGTGLGLAVVKRIVEGHGGGIAVQSRPGAGTVFALSFPLAAPAEKGPSHA